MKKLSIIVTILILIFSAISIYSCQKEATGSSDPGKPHFATIYLTDHPTPVFDSVFIDIRQLEVKLEDDSLPNDGWVSLAIRPGVYNILRFRNGVDTLFGTGTIPNARVKKVRLTLGSQNSVMLNGQVMPLRIKDNDHQVVANLDSEHYEVSNGRVIFWIDLDAANSIQVDNSGSGNNNGYRLKSHIKIFSRNHTGRIEGRVLPRAANPIVKAVLGTDTSTSVPREDGEFKIVGLRPGVYKVIFDGDNNYRDTIIQNVVVRSKEDTELSTITLRQ